MTFAGNQDVELVEFESDGSGSNEVKRHHRRRRRRGKKQTKAGTMIMTAAEILSRAAKDATIESSPSSVFTEPNGRKLSALDLDKIVESEEITCTTETPGSLDSSLSLWELGTVVDEEIAGSMSSSFAATNQVTPPQKTVLVDDITAGIDSILNSLPKSIGGAKADLRRLCIPQRCQTSSGNNRLCIGSAPKVVVDQLEPVRDFIGSVSRNFSETLDRITAALVDSSWVQPEGATGILSSLAPSRKDDENLSIPLQSIPLINRRQRRAVEFSHDSPLQEEGRIKK